MAIILYQFTWATFALADDSDFNRRVTRSLETVFSIELTLIDHQILSCLQQGKRPIYAHWCQDLNSITNLQLQAGTHCCRCFHPNRKPGQKMPDTPLGILAMNCFNRQLWKLYYTRWCGTKTEIDKRKDQKDRGWVLCLIIILYQFTWATFALPDDTNCSKGRIVARSLETVFSIELTLIDHQLLF